MPVTATLSKRFYDQFGEDIANELVDWLNKVDAAQKSEFRELLEKHSARIEGKFDQKFDQLRSEMKAEFATRSEMKAEFGTLRSEMKAEFATRSEIKAEFANVRAEQVRWLFLAWATLLIPLIGLWTR